jgi:hypothetical protein
MAVCNVVTQFTNSNTREKEQQRREFFINCGGSAGIIISLSTNQTSDNDDENISHSRRASDDNPHCFLHQ